MSQKPPKLIAINHDDYHASNIGRTADGSQFFLTTPFVPPIGDNVGREFIALYLFDSEGSLREARIDDLGTREAIDETHWKGILEQRLAELGTLHYCRIEVQPFQLERFGVTFGFVLRPPESEDEEWCVEVLPGNYMAFYEPWDSGEYDT